MQFFDWNFRASAAEREALSLHTFKFSSQVGLGTIGPWDCCSSQTHTRRSALGGCVSAHKRGVPIADLMWKMRLAHAKTLGHYLQEVTAVSILPALSSTSRQKIAILQDAMRFLLEPSLSAQPAWRSLLSLLAVGRVEKWKGTELEASAHILSFSRKDC